MSAQPPPPPPPSGSPPFDLVIRFSTSTLPDLTVRIADPARTSTLRVQQLVRAQLAAPARASRLRLIHAGRALAGGGAVATSLDATGRGAGGGGGGGGGARVWWVHCAVGDVLDARELRDEARAAQEADDALRTRAGAAGAEPPAAAAVAVATAAAPRGFDRLLAAGFTPREVAALRAQFVAIQAHTHTPDAMPTAQELLALEERWLDGGAGHAAGGGAEGGGGGGGGGFGAEDSGGLEDMLYGNLVGFFWPIGAVCWLMREEGVWSRRRQIAVLCGFMVNLLFGGLKWIS